MKETIYWDDDYSGKLQGGFYIRCDLFKKIKHFEDKGYKVIGIRPGDDWNLEFICEVPKDEKKI